VLPFGISACAATKLSLAFEKADPSAVYPYSAIRNSFQICSQRHSQQLFVVNKRLLANFIPALMAICFELPTAVRGGAEF
jgi:hypothetical protein